MIQDGLVEISWDDFGGQNQWISWDIHGHITGIMGSSLEDHGNARRKIMERSNGTS